MLRIVLLCDDEEQAAVARKLGMECIVHPDSLDGSVRVVGNEFDWPVFWAENYGHPVWVGPASGVRKQWLTYCEAQVRGLEVVGVLLRVPDSEVDWRIPAETGKPFNLETTLRGCIIFWQAEQERERRRRAGTGSWAN